MHLKKIFALMLACILTAAIFTGCGEEKEIAPVIKIGMLEHLNASEIEFNGFMKSIAETFALDMPAHEVKYFTNSNSMVMALQSGQIDEISTYKCVADYLAARYPKVQILEGHTLEFIDAFCFALRAEDTELIKDANNAILEMRNDGTLDRLTKEYINDVKGDASIIAVDFDNFADADTIKIAVTGDLPPLDFVSVDGKPAGFNTAVLAELGRRLHKNINIVQIDSTARAAALTSKQADIVFWAIVPVSEIIPANADKPDGIELTSPYYRGRLVHIGLKK